MVASLGDSIEAFEIGALGGTGGEETKTAGLTHLALSGERLWGSLQASSKVHTELSHDRGDCNYSRFCRPIPNFMSVIHPFP